MERVTLTRRVRFSAAHRYWRDDWSEARNREVFGPSANPHGHGHNYVLEATVEGPVDPDTGFIVDLGALDRALHEAVVEPLDHQHVNYVLAEFAPAGRIPSTENLLAWAWPRVEERIPAPAGLRRLRLREDEDLWADAYGSPAGEES